jgi:sodium-dependent dicarboxylate transporter 2/3/5
MKTGLAKRLSLFFLILFKGTPFRILFGIYFISFLFSLLMPEHAVAALLFPMLVKMDHILEIRNKRFEALLFLSMAWGCVSGGIGTPLGGARAPLAMGLLQENFGIEINFLKWTQMAFPVALLLFIFSFFYLFFLSRNLPSYIGERVKGINLENIERISLEEKKVIFIYGIALFAWIFLNRMVDMAVVAILASILLFIFKVIGWKDVESYVNWGIILMYGGAIVLGKTMLESGAASWFASNVLFPFAHSPWSTFWLFAITSIAFTEVMSNVATCAFLLPIAYGFVSVLNVDPFFITLLVALPSGLAFLLPIGSPPNAIAYSSGKYSISRGIIMGIFYIPVSLFSLYLVAKLIWSFMGLGP